MADFFAIKLPDFKGFVNALEKDYEKKTAELKKQMMRAAIVVQGEAQRNVPVARHGKTAAQTIGGRLRASIMAQTEERGAGIIAGAVGTNLKYGVYTEFGTRAHGPKTAKVLSWIDNFTGKRVFAKKVAGIEVGTPEAPRTSWKALSQRGGTGQKMPWLRSAWHTVKDKVEALIREPFEK